MDKMELVIKGVTPLLQHRYSGNKQIRAKKTVAIPTPEEEAEAGCYRDKEGYLIVPSDCLKAAIIRASSFYKVGKKSAKSYIAGCVRVEPYELRILDSKGKPIKDYEIDMRRVQVQRNAVLRSRAMIKDWTLKVTIVYDEEVFKGNLLEVLKEIINEAGVRCGLLDNRPEKGGSNGCFTVSFK